MKMLIYRIIKSAGLYKPARSAKNYVMKYVLSSEAQRRKMLAFYSQFVGSGDLCFDVGANMGNRTQVFLDLGAKVVCIEPQASCFQHLTKLYEKRKDVVLIGKAVGDSEGSAELAICEEDSGISTMSERWRREGRLAEDSQWEKMERVQLTTLDALIASYGLPRFCKIDVEGFEKNVLKGLTQPIPFVSFEFVTEFLEDAKACVDRLLSTGDYQFQLSYRESMTFSLKEWMGPVEFSKTLEYLKGKHLWGDIYASHRAPLLQQTRCSVKNRGGR